VIPTAGRGRRAPHHEVMVENYLDALRPWSSQGGALGDDHITQREYITHDQRVMKLFILLILAFTPIELSLYSHMAGISVGKSPHLFEAAIGVALRLCTMSVTLLCTRRVHFYTQHRTIIQVLNFAVTWVSHVVSDASHTTMVSSAGAEANAQFPVCMMLAISKPVALAFHTQLPLVHDRMLPDLLAYTTATAVQAAFLPSGLKQSDAVLLRLILAVLHLIPISLRILSAYSEDRRKMGMEMQRSLTRAVAARSINHMCKRVMFNVVNGCDIIASKLVAEGVYARDSSDPEGAEHEVFELLRGLGSEARTGFHLCESALVLVRIAAGEYASRFTSTSAATLYAELNLTSRARVKTDADSAVAKTKVGVDRAVLRAIVFNAAHNALQHGANDGEVEITTELVPAVSAEARAPAMPESRSLCIRIRNQAGRNHEKLLGAAGGGGANILTSAMIAHLQNKPQVGNAASTFSGLSDILKFAEAIAARAMLTVHLDHILFEIVCPTTADVTPEASPKTSPDTVLEPNVPGEKQKRQVPNGLVFVCVDDDEIPRIMAQSMLSRLGAHADSCVLGSGAAEVRGVPTLVEQLAAKHGALRVAVILDQNLDFDGSEGTILGTELCRELRAHGFGGLVAIASANDDSESRDEFLRSGANLTLGKSPEEQIGLPERLADALHDLHSTAAARGPKALRPVALDGWLPAQRLTKRRSPHSATGE
jgi:CheY-like chemotaxis protein/signal transduction histidine kinase